MKTVSINKMRCEDCAEELASVNKGFYDLISPIASCYKEVHKDFLYSIGYHFGDLLIKDGKMTLDTVPEKIFNDLYSTANELDLEKEFFESIALTKGHPLSIVTKNYIEIFRSQQSTHQIKDHSKREEYFYPLNVIKEGDLFGVWESINLIFDDPAEPMGWSGAAGKRCLLTLLPQPKAGEANNHYRKLFRKVFGGPNFIEGVNNIAKEVMQGKSFTNVIIIPEFYYVIDEAADSESLKNLKLLFREYIYRKGWKQVEDRRTIQGNENEIIDHFDIKAEHLSYLLPVIKHLVNIIEGKTFVLKPVCSEDNELFEISKAIVKKFKKNEYYDYHLKRHVSLLEYNTPIFFHYSKLDKTPVWGFEMMQSPCIDIILPKQTGDKVKKLLRENLIEDNQLADFLKSKNHSVYFKFYVHKTDTQKEEDGSVNDFVEGPIGEIFKPMLPDGVGIRVSNWPWFFNSLMYIEKRS